MIGIIGGSGLYELFEAERTVEPETPYGPASAPISLATVGGVPTAFLPRHGLKHEYPPHRVPYRANLWALRAVGVTRIVAPCASGSLRADLPPGTFVVCDQFVDRTTARDHTFFDGPDVRHVSAADPYCADLRAVLLAAGREHGLPMGDGGTVVVIEGPRFWMIVSTSGSRQLRPARSADLPRTSGRSALASRVPGRPSAPAHTAAASPAPRPSKPAARQAVPDASFAPS